ncbi:glycosyltransferase family 2 protein [Pedobacter hiemivivus]|uniref:Glycosyltransferase family 2 protein n=1 Tax=Pedobacter hiemivivus TaxID=2530454 RepID=A0A4U1FXY7_9SPHI|nr:glycosyltransferase family 2 protein [Pedobacter hiemivivus]TKC55818.1 glycosyltransferase family 2 protein [Pedobacter hiemivivus]
MKVAGFTFIKSAITNDYPIIEAITSILPICDEFVVAVGKSEDRTLELIESISSPKIKIIETEWDPELRAGGQVFAEETNKAFEAISTDADWAFYIQGDECVHEQYLPYIKQEMESALNDQKIEGLLFKYHHFYGSYDFIAQSRKWYRREIRIVKRALNVKSYKDAQGFRIDDRKIRVKLIDAYINHYGWVKPPNRLIEKGLNFRSFYDNDAVKSEVPQNAEFDYGNAGQLIRFTGSHPAVIKNRIERLKWDFDLSKIKVKSTHSLRQQVLQRIFELTGTRIGEYKNYKLIKK